MDFIIKKNMKDEVILELEIGLDDDNEVKSQKVVVTRNCSTGLSKACEIGVNTFINFTRSEFDFTESMDDTEVLALGNYILAKILELPSKALL